jgi:hypothetical protein
MKRLNIRGIRAEDEIEEERRRRLLTISTICSPHLALNFVPIAAVTISRSSCNMRESTEQYSAVQCSAVREHIT